MTTSTRPPAQGRQPSDQAVDAAIDSASRLLRLPTLRARYGEIADASGREQLSYWAYLSELLLAECDDRQARRATRRIHEAGFPRQKTLADFDFAANPAINPAVVNTLAGCGWITKGQSLCLIGDSGTGKSHLLIGLGTAAAEAGHKVRYVLAAKLVNELVEAADDRQLSRTIARYGRVDLLCIDELGSMELDRRGAELLFQVSPNAKNKTPSRSPATTASPAGPKPSPTPVSAQRLSTASPSAGTSSKPAPTLPTRPRPPPTTSPRGQIRPSPWGQFSLT
jgi:DNA replication protein DnaC